MLYFLPLISTKIIQIYLAEIGLNFAFSVKGTPVRKSTLPPVVAVVTNISYICVRLVVNGRAGVS